MKKLMLLRVEPKLLEGAIEPGDVPMTLPEFKVELVGNGGNVKLDCSGTADATDEKEVEIAIEEIGEELAGEMKMLLLEINAE